MKRRAVVAAGLAAPFLATKPALAADRLVGWISVEPEKTVAPFLAALKSGLAGALPAGSDPVRIVERYEAGTPALAASHVAELQQLGVRLIVAQGAATVTVVAARPSVPVVFGFSGDPIVAGIAQSLSRPGGNATGVSFMSIELNPKRIDFLRSAVPGCRRIALLSNPRHAGEENEIAACQAAVQPLGIELAIYRAAAPAEIRSAIARALDSGAEAVIMLPSAGMVQQAPLAAAECIARKVPLVSGWAAIAHAGALLTYGPNLQEAYKRLALYIVRILGGARPQNLPIEQPSVLELVINQKTAAALGLALPAALLAQADEVIE